MLDALRDNLLAYGNTGLVAWIVLKILAIAVPVIIAVAMFVYWERKVIGWMHVRHGPMYVGMGIFQAFADVFKLLFKEVLQPAVAHPVLFRLAPLIALVPWLWPRWRSALRERDTLTAVLLAWVALVLVFFTFSTGKRGVYVLPAVPALAMAAAPWLPELLRAKGTRRVAFGLGTAMVAFAALAAIYFAVDGKAAERIVRDFGIQPVLPLAIVAALGADGLNDAFRRITEAAA